MKLNEVMDMADTVPESEPARAVLDVHVPANVFDGRYYDARTARVPAYAASEQEAIELVNAHQDEVLRFLDTKRAANGKRRYIGKPIERNVFFKDSYYVKDAGRRSIDGSGVLALTQNGFQKV